MKYFNLFFLLFAIYINGTSQVTIPPDKDLLLKGEIPGQTMAAEENGFPSPQKVIELKDTLGLTKDQLRKIGEILDNLSVSAAVKGQEVVEAEEDLNRLFQSEKINEKLVRNKLERIGKLRGELRFVHLQVCLQMKQLLTAEQLIRFKEIKNSEKK